jgi:hypothetical protein
VTLACHVAATQSQSQQWCSVDNPVLSAMTTGCPADSAGAGARAARAGNSTRRRVSSSRVQRKTTIAEAYLGTARTDVMERPADAATVVSSSRARRPPGRVTPAVLHGPSHPNAMRDNERERQRAKTWLGSLSPMKSIYRLEVTGRRDHSGPGRRSQRDFSHPRITPFMPHSGQCHEISGEPH